LNTKFNSQKITEVLSKHFHEQIDELKHG